MTRCGSVDCSFNRIPEGGVLFWPNQFFDITTVFLGWSSTAAVAEETSIGSFLTCGFEFVLGSFIFVKLWNSFCADTFFGDTDDVHCFGELLGPCDDGIARTNFVRGLGDHIVDAHCRAAARVRCITASFVDPYRPEPFINSNRGRFLCGISCHLVGARLDAPDGVIAVDKAGASSCAPMVIVCRVLLSSSRDLQPVGYADTRSLGAGVGVRQREHHRKDPHRGLRRT